MQQHIAHIALVVTDYDEAIYYYTTKLNFKLIKDITLSEAKRWVLLQPIGGSTSLLLAKASNEEQKSRIGNQTGGRVFLFLHTDNFQRDYEHLKANDVVFISEPRYETYGTVAVFEDLYGNRWDLIEPTKNLERV
jgi:catechol 2,3-dioxygenase-like lactoylglutathione lyase family enzyme